MTTRSPNMTSRNDAVEYPSAGTVSAAMTMAFMEFAVAVGADRTALIEASSLVDFDLETDDARLPMQQFVRLVSAAKAQTNNPALPILFANHADFSEVSIAGLIANASRTMLHALMQLNRYGRLAIETPFEGDAPLAFERSKDADWIIDQRTLSSLPPELTEITFTYLVTGPRKFLPRPHIIDAQVIHDAPAHRHVYDEIWQCPVRFNASTNALRLHKWVADHPVNLQPAYAFGILTKHADQMLSQLHAQHTFSAEIERLILPSVHTGDVSIDWAAAQLQTSRQSIYRRLKVENTTFEELLDALRHKLALEYMHAGKTTIAEIAYLLGYSDASPFSRAFKRWTGRMPGAYRKLYQKSVHGA